MSTGDGSALAMPSGQPNVATRTQALKMRRCATGMTASDALDAAPAVDLQGDAGDGARCVGGEVERGRGDVVRRGEAPERDGRAEAPLGLVEILPEAELGDHRGAHGHRADRVDAH